MLVRRRGERRLPLPRRPKGALLARGEKELGEGQRMQIPGLDAPHRHPQVFGIEREFQQRPGADDEQLGHLLPEVAERREGPGTVLDLVEEEERPPRLDRTPAKHRDPVEDRPRLQGVEALPVRRPLLEVDLREVLEASLGERPDRPGLPDLPSPANQQRQPAPVVHPLVQGLVQKSVHGGLLRAGRRSIALIGRNCPQK